MLVPWSDEEKKGKEMQKHRLEIRNNLGRQPLQYISK